MNHPVLSVIALLAFFGFGHNLIALPNAIKIIKAGKAERVQAWAGETVVAVAYLIFYFARGLYL